MRSAPIEKTGPGSTDTEIAAHLAAGDAQALAVLMKRYNQKLYRTARAILKDDAEAEDAVQEAFILATRSIGTFRGDAKLSTWLVRIVVNESLGRLRKRARSAEIIQMDGDIDHETDRVETSMDENTSEHPERAALRAEARRLLEKTIDSLPDAFRTVFVLRAIEELTVEETADALGIPEATVRTRFFRARSLLRESLSREIDFAHEDAFAFAGERCDRIVAAVLARFTREQARDA